MAIFGIYVKNFWGVALWELKLYPPAPNANPRARKNLAENLRITSLHDPCRKAFFPWGGGIGRGWATSIPMIKKGRFQMSQGQKSRFIGDKLIQPLIGNPYNGYINPYYWVDDHPLLYGNNGSLDLGTNDPSL